MSPIPSLFIIATDLLARLINLDSSVKKLKVFNMTFGISQLADDTTLFLQDADQISLSISLVYFFSKASGLHLNKSNVSLCPFIIVITQQSLTFRSKIILSI